MRILITGATGFVGQNLSAYLEKQKHSIVGVGRRLVSLKDLEGVDAVINLAGAPIAAHRWTANQKKQIFDSRVLGTRHLMDLISQMPADQRPTVLISASAIGFYGDRGDEILTESSSSGVGFLSEVCQAWENEIFVKKIPDLRTVCLRFGLILGKNGGFLSKMLPIFKWGLGGPTGNGRQWMSWIHIDDLIEIIDMILKDSSKIGIFNAVSPNPVSNKEFCQILASVLKRPAFFVTPAFILKLALGEMSCLMLASQRASSEKITNTGFQFRFPRLRDALQQT